MTLIASERERLNSFRRAAREVRDASIIAEGRSVQVHAVPDNAGCMDIYVELLAYEAFRSLALAIRLAYQQREPAHFYSICNILTREGNTEIRERVAHLRDQYRDALRDPAGGVTVDDGQRPNVFSATEVLEHWLYGMVFHQDVDRQPAVKRLLTAGPRFLWSVQRTSLQAAGRILDLDDVVAAFLEEPPLPRINPSPGG